MNLVETALQIALSQHAGQKDKAGKAYILHPLRLLGKMQTESEMAAALLHDVLEDTDCSVAELLDAGIPAHIVEAVQCLSRNDAENYQQFIQRLSVNALARKVKKADLEDNMNMLRLDKLALEDVQRLQKYHAAWKKLAAME